MKWLNRSVLGIGLASLLSDWSHEMATAVLPALLAGMGGAAAWIGVIEGGSDSLSSLAKLASGYYTDRLQRRKPVAVAGYLITACGTACFGLATQAWHVLAARAAAWLGRGVRTPVRKALLAAAVTPATYGRAFGFERMMDTLGAVVGPASALGLLALLHEDYRRLFFVTLLPGLLAAAAIAFLVEEKERRPVGHVSFGASLRALPADFRRFLVAVGVFGAGDFSHTLLILLAAQRLAPTLGPDEAARVAVGLYVFHNVLYAASSLCGGWLADHCDKRRLLMSGYLCAALMAALILLTPPTLGSFLAIFASGGIFMGVVETAEDTLCAELVSAERHGMAFGTLATVNGVGDFVSSLAVGLLWNQYGIVPAFGWSLVLTVMGALLLSTRSRAVGGEC